MSITEERKQKVDFTGKYYNTPAKFIAKKGAGIEITPEGLEGKTVGVQRATIHENFVRDKFPGAEVSAYGTQDEANADLVAGRVDLVMADSVALDEGFLKTPEGADFEFVGPDYNDPVYHGEGAGIAIRKGEDELRQAFDDAIKAIRANGKYDEIQKKYFAYDVYGEPAM
jgi:ABC-type amino acid transport substrate-binding protein